MPDKNFITMRIEELCSLNNYNMYTLSKVSGVPVSTLSGIYSQNHFPSIPTLYKLCVALNITLSDFFLVTKKPDALTERDLKLLHIINSLSETKRRFLDAYIDALANP